LALSERVFRCDHCGHAADRDVNAARNIAHEAARLLEQQHEQTSSTSPGYDRETLNADRRPQKTSKALADLAAVV
jgi:transposase